MGIIFDIYLSDGFKLVINKGRKYVGNISDGFEAIIKNRSKYVGP